jgi:hypothetical protein
MPTTASPSPTQSYSTENEIASVIAGGEKMWRDTKDEAFDCRLALVLKEDDYSASAKRLTCYTNELTAGVKAQTALRDLAALTIPPSMDGLVTDTRAALQLVVDADLENACGPAMTEPKDTEECSSALGARSMSYTVLSSALDKWAPYL